MVGRLCEKIESLENALKESLAKEPSAKENLHVPMTVEEVCSYLGISKSSFYYKAKHGGIPVIKQGKHLFVYRDELDKWLETGRKNQVPLSFEKEHEQMLAATRHKAKTREM
jgi:excisionase family DNA binding protein